MLIAKAPHTSRRVHPSPACQGSLRIPLPRPVFTDDDISLGFDDVRSAGDGPTPLTRCAHTHVIGTTGSGKSAFSCIAFFRTSRAAAASASSIRMAGTRIASSTRCVASCATNGWFDTGKVHIIAPNSREHVVGFNPLAPMFVRKIPPLSPMPCLRLSSRVWGNENADISTPMIHRVLLATFIALPKRDLPLAEAIEFLDYEDRLGLRRELIASSKNPVARHGLEDIQRLARSANASELQPNGHRPGEPPRRNSRVRCDPSHVLRRRATEATARSIFLEIMDRGDILLVDLQRGDAMKRPDCKLLGNIIVRYLFRADGEPQRSFRFPTASSIIPSSSISTRPTTISRVTCTIF